MVKKPTKKKTPDPPSPFDVIASLGEQPGNYTARDKYRDFKTVFLSTAEGRRVLWTLLGWCRVFQVVSVRGDPHHSYFRDGARSIGLRILETAGMEPPAGGEITSTVTNESEM